MIVFRKIFLDNLDDLDLDNLGCHFSKTSTYVHNGGNAKGVTVKKKYQINICAEVKKSQINQEATQISNEEHPKEQEVVLKTNTKIKAEYQIVETATNKFYGGFHRHEIAANTGNRVDEWVKNMK